MMLERGLAARSAISVFYELFNDIDIYIEDTAEGYDKIFSKLLNRSLGSSVKIDKIFPIGSRRQVLNDAQLNLISKPNRKSVFIVDGDLYLLCGEFETIPRNVIVLPRYCVENFLFDEKSILELLDEEDTCKDIECLRDEFSYASWMTTSTMLLRPLFLIFSVAHFLRSGIKTVTRSSKDFCKDQHGNIDSVKVAAAYNEIHKALSEKFGVVEVEYLIRKIDSKIPKEICFTSTYVSGNDFILPLLFLRLKSISKSKSPNINLKLRLASKCSLSPLKFISEKITTHFNTAQ